ncbi:antibiotic biosynthesis monooxygenase family protein [Maridesulfovibrio hydrothermalis]|uniref:Antibiotic biosynthesis monooxygenase n=1 Tax=Maridesulfovibrio hydrothermalis AM13 = DSM 14728 TaxID=1121451 RepID=L0RFD4_9BACT|nr:antibiotic biosynthesis monooxygenase [Maridesulfovibrio hydrothermalis]CCO25498.1 Antibiotic biosynthesis monooxygenase [Maridesulfovibrio hydrothermalis AM13 = DSM 14728]
MFAVIFEVKPKDEGKAEYLEIAGKIKKFLEEQKGFISIERFQSLADERKVLSLSFWEDEPSIERWRKLLEHRDAQKHGKYYLFESYRIRVAEVVRDYSDTVRSEAPADSSNELL